MQSQAATATYGVGDVPLQIVLPPNYPRFDSADAELLDRLAAIPESAACRGLYVNMLDKAARSLGEAVQRAYREHFPVFSVSSIRMHPLQDYLRRVHWVALRGFGEAEIATGRAYVQSYAAEAFEGNIVGRTLTTILGPRSLDGLLQLFRWIGANRQLAVNYGRWRFDKAGDGVLGAEFENEYNYIESAMFGAIATFARMRGFEPTFVIRLSDRFNGSMTISLRDKA